MNESDRARICLLCSGLAALFLILPAMSQADGTCVLGASSSVSEAAYAYLFPNWRQAQVTRFDVWLCDTEVCDFPDKEEIYMGLTVLNYGTASAADIVRLLAGWRGDVQGGHGTGHHDLCRSLVCGSARLDLGGPGNGSGRLRGRPRLQRAAAYLRGYRTMPRPGSGRDHGNSSRGPNRQPGRLLRALRRHSRCEAESNHLCR